MVDVSLTEARIKKFIIDQVTVKALFNAQRVEDHVDRERRLVAEIMAR